MGAPFDMFPHIQAGGLMLRRLAPGDVDDLFAVFGDEDLFRYIPMGMFRKNRESVAKMLGHFERDFAKGKLMVLGIVPPDAPQTVAGVAEMFEYDAQVGMITIGYMIARQHSGRGLASGAVAAMVRYLFEETDVNRIQAQVAPENEASLRVLRRNGFTQEGTIRQGCWQRGHGVVDLTMLSLLRAEYRG